MPPCKRFPALPLGPSLRSGFCCPGPSSLNRPHPPHSRAHPVFTAGRFIRHAFAVPIPLCLGDPRLVLSFPRCSFTTCRPLRPRGTLRLSLPSTSPQTLAFHSVCKFRHSHNPHTPILLRGGFSRLTYRSLCYDRLLCLPSCRSGPDSHPAIQDVSFRACDGWVARAVAGYHYRANWAICTGGTFTRSTIV